MSRVPCGPKQRSATKAATSYARKMCFALRAVGEVGSARRTVGKERSGRAKALSPCSFRVFSLYAIGLKSAFAVDLSRLMQKTDVEPQASLPRRIFEVG